MTGNDKGEMREMPVWERVEVHSPMHTVRMQPERPCFCVASRMGMPVLFTKETECKERESDYEKFGEIVAKMSVEEAKRRVKEMNEP